MGNNAVSPYQQVIEKTKMLSYRSHLLTMNIEKKMALSNRNEVGRVLVGDHLSDLRSAVPVSSQDNKRNRNVKAVWKWKSNTTRTGSLVKKKMLTPQTRSPRAECRGASRSWLWMLALFEFSAGPLEQDNRPLPEDVQVLSNEHAAKTRTAKPQSFESDQKILKSLQKQGVRCKICRPYGHSSEHQSSKHKQMFGAARLAALFWSCLATFNTSVSGLIASF